MSVTDCRELGAQVVVFGSKMVFRQATQSRNECKVQCVAQTCLEKGRTEEQVYGEKRGGRKKTGGGYSICFTAKQITGEAARLTIMSGGAPVARKAGLCVGNGV